MKFLDTLKQYEKLVIKENAKLQNLYASLINEAKEEGIKVDEDDILNNRPHNVHVAEGETEKTDGADTSFAEAEDQIPKDEFMEAAETEEVEEAEDDVIDAAEFFKDSETKEEAEDQIPEDEFMEATAEATESKKEEVEEAEPEEVEEAEDDIPTAEEFFATESEDKEEEVKEGEKCPECGKDPCVCEKDGSKEEEVDEVEDKEDLEEDDKEMMSADEFFKDSEEVDEAEDKEEEVKEGEKCPDCGKDPCICEKDGELTADDFIKDSEDEDVKESEGKEEEVKESAEKEEADKVEESKKTADEELEESLDQYRKMNARLFQD